MTKRHSKMQPPSGQPYAHPRTRIIERNGKRLPTWKRPHQIVDIKSKGSLLHALKHYSHPFPWMDGSVHFKNKTAARYMIEWTFPALRWYCKVYGVTIPKWLKGNGWATHLSETEQRQYFGDKPLQVREFKEDKLHQGERA